MKWITRKEKTKMNENSTVNLKKSAAFEATGEEISIEITVHNSSPDRLKLISGTADVLYEELRQYFKDGKSVPPTGGSNIPRPRHGEHLREILLHLQEVAIGLDFNISKIGQGDNASNALNKLGLIDDLGQLRQAIRKLEARID
ncbi:hypothetical protein ABNB59_20885 [Paenibacillus larvae]|uniref:Uncharacterized protein n=1 Tax=Bacteriophage Lily TaxID=1589751 RepID=A0A0C5AJ78_9CAUD|nr:hypothetical protein [Paenibacillus larvae]YP_009202255.1 hypothetical protein AVV24_gp49 [Bacteriophage Lily]AJK27773.1 hypothetical protein LILY_49 [Bacteriophage Lily]MCY9564826.1 hypothetical protein [Paenibacillus larvae]MCY9566839.1 hypothetical protein [Paenibacillus larvae]MCY9571885.1 hypothetical protein [Paenibacillus larvae]MCY9690599.1 hypothetical protein [Paenibacillus larvae]